MPPNDGIHSKLSPLQLHLSALFLFIFGDAVVLLLSEIQYFFLLSLHLFHRTNSNGLSPSRSSAQANLSSIFIRSATLAKRIN